MRKEVLIILVVFFLSGVSAAKVQDDIHLNIKATDSNGNVQTGTFNFAFNISNSSTNTCDSSNIVYSNSTTLQTNSNGVISYYLQNVSLNYSEQHWLCHYRNGSLQETTQIAASPRALSVDSGDVEPNGALNLTGIRGLFEFLGSLTNRITTLFVKNINASGDINASGTVRANKFIQDGSAISGAAPSAINLTSSKYDGKITNGSKKGYAAANQICGDEFSGAHLCNEFEVMRAYDSGNADHLNNVDAWINAGGPKYVPADTPVNDCNGWTYNGTSDYLGNYWHFDSSTGGDGRAINCGTEFKLACCS
ncbi:MAG: hypothetical protein ABEI74_03005 [Candidatus Pacearchaeota archaeon]